MDDEQFARLLDQAESDRLDFKRELWDLGTEEGSTDFLKDVICMANTPREHDAHIIVGVGIDGGGKKTLVGISGVVDDADLQQKFDGKVHPVPLFTFETKAYGGTNYGILTVPPAKYGPSLPQRDLPKAKLRWRAAGVRNTGGAAV